MTTKKSVNSNFLLQGSILAIAGILVRVIGLIYRIPLNNILGDEGLGYYSTAYNIYSILLLLSSQSMPLAVSKIVTERVSKKEYVNVKRAFIVAMCYAIIVGVICGMIAFFGADIWAGLYKKPSSARALRVLAPTLTVVSIIGVLRGYFQGMGDIVPTALSQLFEQIINAIVSVFAAYELASYGSLVAAATNEERATNAASFSAAGGTLGTCLGAVTAFIVLIIIFMRRRKDMAELALGDKSKQEAYSKITKVIIFTITPILLSTTIYQVGNLIDDLIYGNVMSYFYGFTEKTISTYTGIYSNYKLLTTMPMAIASALTLSLVPAVVKSFKVNKMSEVVNKIDTAFKFTTIIAFPCGVGLSVLGAPIYTLLFPGSSADNSTVILMAFSIFTVVGFSISTISNSILQSIDHLSQPIISCIISLIIHMILLPIMLIPLNLNVYALIIGDFSFAIVICFINAMAINRYINYKMKLKEFFLIPFAASAVMGAVAYAVYYVINTNLVAKLGHVILMNDISVCLAIIVAVPVYFAVLIKMGGITEEQIKSFPMGNKLALICRKCKLF